MNQTLLIELLTEELPPKALSKLGDAFAQGIFEQLKKSDFLGAGSTATMYATPRRVAVSIDEVRKTSPAREETVKLMPVSAGRDAAGNMSPALQKKLQALGAGDTTLADLEIRNDGKTDAFYLTRTVAGQPLATGVQAALDATIKALPIPKVMTYQRPDGTDVQFVRPAHGLICLWGADIVPVSALGIAAGRVTRGHRFLSDGAITVDRAGDYAQTLSEKGRVSACYASRRVLIRASLLEKAGGDGVLMPDALLDEVTSLVEWPVVYECHFDEAFLAVPQECLILTMQTNQKYFALTDAEGRLRSRFLIVSNIATDDPRAIVEGNERVVHPRLADAKFFFEQDKKCTLESRLPDLAKVVYHNKLGTQAARAERVTFFAGKIAALLGVDAGLAERAARLSRCDLVTKMVGEFPELQGVMGTYYARIDGEPEAVSKAIAEHYQPRYSGDALPTSTVGTVVALADKLETLVGIWGIGLAPTGEKDPFALRRHALGILRILIEKALPVSLNDLLLMAERHFDAGNYADFSLDRAALRAFLDDRLRGLLRDRKSAVDEIEAVLAIELDALDTIPARLAAIREFAALPEAPALAAANKRIGNILKKSEAATVALDAKLLKESAEQQLHAALAALQPDVEADLVRGDYKTALCRLAALRASVDAFFTDVMVNVDDAALRANRLALLAALHVLMNRVADTSRLA